MTVHDSLRALLEWYREAGIEEATADVPIDRYAAAESAPVRTAPARPPMPPPAEARPAPAVAAVRSAAAPPDTAEGVIRTAVKLAEAARSVAELRDAVAAFEGCPLRKTATNLVFADGAPDAKVIFIGEAPGAEEDRQGVPFVGPSGRLLDRMLTSIDLDRTEIMISNTVFWRPPGNRSPTTIEVATCAPFVEKLIELVNPRILVALGGPSAKSLLGQTMGIGRLRGKWFAYSTPRMARPIDAAAMFHPAYLLRSPLQKREAWRDLLALRDRLDVPSEPTKAET